MAAHDRTHAHASALSIVSRLGSKALAAGLASATLLAGSSYPARLSAQSDSFVDDGDDGDSIYGEGDRPSDRVRLAGSGTRAIPPTHTVRRGDTLWDVTGHYYGNPWEWPRVWSYNPEVTNPHWIYPDDVLRLLPGGVAPVVTSGGVRVVSRGARGEGSVYLREQGYLDIDALRNSGEIIGSPTDHMLLSPYDEVYVRFDELDGGRPPAGEYTIFRELAEGIENEREAGDTGTLVRILGAVRVDEWDEERRTARATITEALDPIERGYRIAAIPRRFAVVPPVPADRDLESEVVASLRPSLLIGAEQIVFVSVGEEDGVRDGNRFFIVRSGDEWRRTLESSDGHEHGAALALPASPEEWPEEVIAEGRVVALRPHSAGLFITRSVRVVERGDRAEMRRGY